jgi:Flp pilus assembly protein TadD
LAARFGFGRPRKNDDALQEFLKTVELAPTNFELRMDLGLMLMRQGNLSEATSQLNEALRLKPDNAELGTTISDSFF